MSEVLGTVRASSVAELFDCAYRWEAKHILKIQRPMGYAVAIGTALHAATAVLDQSRIDGNPVSPAEAADVFVTALADPKDDIVRSGDDFTQKQAEQIGVTLINEYARVTKDWIFTAVEQDVGELDIRTQHGVIRVRGTLDRSRTREAGGKKRITDIKSGQRAVGADGVAVTEGHHLQVGIYRLLAQASSGEEMDTHDEIIGLHVAAKSARVGVGVMENTTLSLLGTDEAPGLLELAAHTLKTGLFMPNPKSKICGAKYCPRWDTCVYRTR